MPAQSILSRHFTRNVPQILTNAFLLGLRDKPKWWIISLINQCVDDNSDG